MFVKDHPPPHFHAVYGEYEALVDIESGAVIEGRLPRSASALVQQWATQHKAALMENWRRRMAGEMLERIPGLDAD